MPKAFRFIYEYVKTLNDLDTINYDLIENTLLESAEELGIKLLVSVERNLGRTRSSISSTGFWRANAGLMIRPLSTPNSSILLTRFATSARTTPSSLKRWK